MNLAAKEVINSISSINKYFIFLYYSSLFPTLILEELKTIVNGGREEHELRGIRKIQNKFPYPVFSLSALVRPQVGEKVGMQPLKQI